MTIRTIVSALILAIPSLSFAQIGDHRNDFAVGFNGGYVLSDVGFTPTVSQGMHGGMTGGVTFRYVCEKYFKTICSVQAEVNYSQIGWKEDIKDVNDQPVVVAGTQIPKEYSRTINYLQIPVFAHLAWGRERKGANFYFQVGPQVGFCMSESTKSNFTMEDARTDDRANKVVAQDTMAVENKFDYGIAGGLGLEYSVPKVGHFQLEARYYYGLGNIYGNSKHDFFGKSNFGNIVVKLTYLFDITKAK